MKWEGEALYRFLTQNSLKGTTQFNRKNSFMENKKIYHSIGQVSNFLDLPQSVLRYWETVFKRLTPHKSPGGNRLYSDADVKLIKRIKELLYEKKFTIKGANAQLERDFNESGELVVNEQAETENKNSALLSPSELRQIVNKLKELIAILED